jgi:hypothetical protein
VNSICTIKFGSHLYGTSTPGSDLDYKSVFLPQARDILLQRIKPTIQNHKEKSAGEKNKPGDVDREAFALHRYLSLLAEGQTVALDMLFAPDWAMVEPPAPLWRTIVENRRHLVSSKAAAFVGYCRTQANKYGIRGSRVHAVRNIVEWFDAAIAERGHLAKMFEAADGLPEFIKARQLDHTQIIDIQHPNQSKPVAHLECCNRKTPFFNSLKDARAIYARLLAEYGDRSLQAERNEGADWKALSHAVRVGSEALEFMSTAWITFPLPNAEHILAIKQGTVPYAKVADEIEGLLEAVEAAQATSCLPAVPDQEFIDALVADTYRAVIRSTCHD